jgi:hypothetical protein
MENFYKSLNDAKRSYKSNRIGHNRPDFENSFITKIMDAVAVVSRDSKNGLPARSEDPRQSGIFAGSPWAMFRPATRIAR